MARILLATILVSMTISSIAACLQEWNNQCKSSADCCSGLVCDNPQGWATGVCKTSGTAPAPTTATVRNTCPDAGTPPAAGPAASTITYDQFAKGIKDSDPLFPVPTMAQYSSFMKGLSEGGITTKWEAAMALAQFTHESGGLAYKREWACLPENGNYQCVGHYQDTSCDKPNNYYYGRGYIQITWCANYKKCSQDLGLGTKLVDNPDLVGSDEDLAWRTAFWYWKTRVHSYNGVQYGRFGCATRAINGGLECQATPNETLGQSQKRFKFYKAISAAFGIPVQSESGCY